MATLKLRSGKTLEIPREIAKPIHEKWGAYKMEPSEARRKTLGQTPIFIGEITFELADVKYFDLTEARPASERPFSKAMFDQEAELVRLRRLAADEKADILLQGAAILFLYTKGAPFLKKSPNPTPGSNFIIEEPHRTNIRRKLCEFFSDPAHHNEFFLPRDVLSSEIPANARPVQVVQRMPDLEPIE